MKKIILFLGIFALILACSLDTSEIPSLEVGQDFADSDVRVISLDTFTVAVSTMRFDSIVTSGTDRILVGQYVDSFFGEVKATNFMELSPPVYELPSDAELDSVGLVLGYDGYFYNDTIIQSTLNVHLLTDDLRDEDGFFYNTSEISFDSVPLATYTYLPEPKDEDSLFIKLPQDFGLSLFEGIRDNDINNLDELLETFQGISIRPGVMDNSSIIGFSSNGSRSYIRFFYRIPQEFDDEEGSLDFVVQENLSEPKIFNNIQNTLSNSVLDTLIDQEINLPSPRSNNRSFIQAGTGYAARIQFPTIKQLFDIPGQGTILSATLQLKPPPSTYNDNLPIRDSLTILLVNQNNRITEQLFFGGEPVFGVVNEQLKEFDELIYEIPIGVYVDRELNETNLVDDAFIVYPPEFGQSVDRVILEGEESQDFKATLIITYAIYDEDE
ncbi:DUF4270 family protein [Flagellimonas meridianipacifica]|uniref:Uncharacterized protein DUF4270 n=1 Tax=Flagellimonas meridianipacifica TaxID=1080225 RepID=A0A2T0MD30_9FLAO|nr:DUF4270 family protein [Allomuricauda pacifica]PRX55397.1 uncharacterized protein DUF4270 [Allomuricauda pacifica]